MRRALRLALALGAVAAQGAAAQGWRATIDLRTQATSYRGWRLDSIPAADTVAGPEGGPRTPDGYVARCDGGPVCRYWRPGTPLRGIPAILTGDATLWGLGLPGLSLHARGRAGTDLGAGDPWYGPDRDLELMEGYADLERVRWEARVGRQTVSGRTGWWGLDGARGWWRTPSGATELSLYAGWGLARSSDLTVTSAALDPLGDFQTGRRQRAVGATARWAVPRGSLAAEYHREVSGVDGGVTIERAALGGEAEVARGIEATGGATYDLASGLWGSWDAGLSATRGRWAAAGRVRQYRPLFDLWSVWQAFSPTAYHALSGTIGGRPRRDLEFHLSGERYWYDPTATETPLVSVVDHGWRGSLGGNWAPSPGVGLDGEVAREFGVGALANSVEGSAHWTPRAGWMLRLSAGRVERPLEYRYDVADLDWVGLGTEWRHGARLRAGVDVDHWHESRARPDAAAFAWDQWRVAARLTWVLVSEADRLPLPPARGVLRP